MCCIRVSPEFIVRAGCRRKRDDLCKMQSWSSALRRLIQQRDTRVMSEKHPHDIEVADTNCDHRRRVVRGGRPLRW